MNTTLPATLQATLPATLATSLPSTSLLATGAPTGAPVKLGDEQRMGMSTVEKITIAIAIAVCIVLTGLIATVSSRRGM